MTIGRIGRLAAPLIASVFTVAAGPVHAERITNPVAEFAGLDKITGRIISFDVYIGEKVQFGALQVTPRACYSRPPTEQPQTDAFVEVDEVTFDKKVRRIFTGWMFAASPGLHAVEHPVYDVWLTDCKQSSNVPPPDNYDGPPVIEKVAPDDPLGNAPRDPNAPPPNIPREKPQLEP